MEQRRCLCRSILKEISLTVVERVRDRMRLSVLKRPLRSRMPDHEVADLVHIWSTHQTDAITVEDCKEQGWSSRQAKRVSAKPTDDVLEGMRR